MHFVVRQLSLFLPGAENYKFHKYKRSEHLRPIISWSNLVWGEHKHQWLELECGFVKIQMYEIKWLSEMQWLLILKSFELILEKNYVSPGITK